jgi:mannose-6-phosphate isomerase-like protein (cupin superfamily)
MNCLRLDEGEPFWCAGNLYSMLLPREQTQCFEAVLETIAPGGATPPNAHDTFVQLFVLLRGTARVHIDGEMRVIGTPAVAFIPQRAQHHVENVGEVPLQYIYVSIWPGVIPVEEGLTWREASDQMIKAYEARGHVAEPGKS